MIERAVRELGSADPRTADRAATSLVAWGDAAVDPLVAGLVATPEAVDPGAAARVAELGQTDARIRDAAAAMLFGGGRRALAALGGAGHWRAVALRELIEGGPAGAPARRRDRARFVLARIALRAGG